MPLFGQQKRMQVRICHGLPSCRLTGSPPWLPTSRWIWLSHARLTDTEVIITSMSSLRAHTCYELFSLHGRYRIFRVWGWPN